ncbi:MAG: GNAT family N-acetyltransferase [Desulfobacterales bacterium]|nr:GNAT family N-acetyltransferase [Desulfobacterales bacterium]
MEIKENRNYEKLMKVFLRNGLEEPSPDDTSTLLKAWEIIEDEQVVGGSSVTNHNGAYVLEYFAIDEPFRDKGWSRQLFELAIAYLKEQSASIVYIVTKIPSYFKKVGFEKIDRKDAPDFSECFDCQQYMENCFPEVMAKPLTI